MIKVLAAFLLWSSTAFAKNDCSTIDLSGDAGESWDQVRTYWCHAFTTTDAFSQHLRKKGYLKKGESVHPLQVAVALPINDGQSPVNSTGRGSTMLKDMDALSWAARADDELMIGERINQGLCKVTDLEPEKDQALALFNADFQKAHQLFGSDACQSHGPPCPPRNRFERDVQKVCAGIANEETEYWAKIFKERCKTPWPDWRIQPAYSEARYSQMRKGRVLKPTTRYPSQVDRAFEKQIEKALLSGEFAAIGYDVSFLRREGAERPESHWSSVVGRRKGPDGKCYYALRNSWGSDCSFYKQSVGCKKGLLLVPAEELAPRLHSVQYFLD